jgi:hypothetical protein
MGPAFAYGDGAKSRVPFAVSQVAMRDVLIAALTALIAALGVAALYLTALLLEARW